MTIFWNNSVKLKRILFIYWLMIPVLFGSYVFVFAAVKNVSVTALFTNIPSLALTSIVALLSFFQVFILYKSKNSSNYRQSFFGVFLKFSMIQQLCSLNVIGLLLCILVYRSLLEGSEQVEISKQVKIQVYSSMVFIALVTFLVVGIRFSL